MPGSSEIELKVERALCKNVRFPDEEVGGLEERLAGLNPRERFRLLEREFRLNDYFSGSSGQTQADSDEVLFELLPHGLLCLEADFPDLELSSGEVSRSEVRMRSAEGQEVSLELLVSMAGGQVAFV